MCSKRPAGRCNPVTADKGLLTMFAPSNRIAIALVGSCGMLAVAFAGAQPLTAGTLEQMAGSWSGTFSCSRPRSTGQFSVTITRTHTLPDGTELAPVVAIQSEIKRRRRTRKSHAIYTPEGTGDPSVFAPVKDSPRHSTCRRQVIALGCHRLLAGQGRVIPRSPCIGRRGRRVRLHLLGYGKVMRSHAGSPTASAYA